MSDYIRLHPKHGMNPTIPVCFWCGKDKNEVALLGAAYRGEAPRHMLIDHEPCPECAAQMAMGITLIEATPGDPPEYTGRWAVLKEEAVAELFSPPSLVEAVLKSRRAFIEPDAFRKLFGHADTLKGLAD